MQLADSNSRTLYIKISNPQTADSRIESNINWSTTPNYLGSGVFRLRIFRLTFGEREVGTRRVAGKNSKEIFHNFLRGTAKRRNEKKRDDSIKLKMFATF